MSVNTHIFLPSDVRCLEVAKTVAVLAGLSPFATDNGFDVKGLEIMTLGGMPGPMVRITLTGPMVDGAMEHRFCLSYESSELPGHDRQISVRSTAFWVAMGRRLIQVFGGALFYNEYESKEPDELEVRQWPYPCEVDDFGCLDLSSRIFKLKPLPIDEMQSAADCAYYGWGDD